ncbi:MAG: ATP-binding protein [Xenococcus sp. MO_188.B8]|nr:ATP-binding protein [Xenococcus sp. MO_188.B8]
MTAPLICHFLIGLPGSGKSTLARNLQKMIANSVVVSSDTARKELYGDESIQGDWVNEVEPEVLRQIKDLISNGKPVIYDATNVRRNWRMGILLKIEDKFKEINSPPVYWVAWHLQTPVDVCQQWNHQRDRNVPDRVIEDYAELLNQFSPHKGEGFIQISAVSINDKSTTDDFSYQVKVEKKTLDLQQAIAIEYDFSKKQNRSSKYIWHQYSRLLDFDRLMHLMSTVIRYPGIGNLSQSEPETLKQALGVEELPKFATAIEEIAAVIKKEYSPLYADPQKIKGDLVWLEKNGLIGNTNVEAELDIAPLARLEITAEHQLFTHRYSNLEAFSRLIKIIRLITYEPFLCIEGKTATQKTITTGNFSETVRHTAIVGQLINQKILPIDIDDLNSRKKLENLVREDIRQLKPYRIIHDPFNTTPYSQVTKKFAMNKGYFIGTGIFSQNELNEVFNLLRSQSEKEYFNDPLAGNLYQTFQERMKNSKLWQDAPPYPVKVIGSKSVVDFNEDRINRSRFEKFEVAIRNRKLINLEFLRQPWDNQDQVQHLKVYPLQIVFHLFAWYLGYEIAEGKNEGLLYFERIDRLRVDSALGERTEERQIKALNKLNILYQASAGIYLGNSVSEQQKYLNRHTRKSVESTVKIYATNDSFKFLSETTHRFPENQMKMTLPEWLEGKPYNKKIYSLNQQQNQYPHVYRIDITLPKWSVDDIYLIKWLVPWGKEVKVTQPLKLVKKIQQRGDEIQELYNSTN